MRLFVDRRVCQGHARCVDIAPDFFDIDDEDLAVVLQDDVNPESLGILQDAVASCPEGAIALISDDSA